MTKCVILSTTHHINSKKIQIGVTYCPSRAKRIKLNKPIKIKTPIELSRWYSTRRRAKKKSVDFDITVEDIKELIYKPCIYCNSNRVLSEIDRKIPSAGYTKNNIAPACRRCNTIKNNVVSYDEMMFIANYLGWRK